MELLLSHGTKVFCPNIFIYKQYIDALRSVGGLWINSITINSEGQAKRIATLPHELGHNFGLWHTFHGVSEVSGCGNACKENVHPIVDPQADTVGDFCADTPATPQVKKSWLYSMLIVCRIITVRRQVEETVWIIAGELLIMKI